MPRTFRFACKFKCLKCKKVFKKMGSCTPKVCAECGAEKTTFELVEKIDLKK